jgi:hypothetical protein
MRVRRVALCEALLLDCGKRLSKEVSRILVAEVQAQRGNGRDRD